MTHSTAPLCPLCQGSSAISIHPRPLTWADQRYTYRRCLRCRCIFVDPLPTDEQLGSWYAHGSYHAAFYSSTGDEVYAPAVRRLERWRPAPSRVLDFGSGSGGFLRAAAARGYHATGVELSDSTVDAARASGLDVLSLTALESSEQRFDVIHLGDVLEHLPKPADLLRRLEKHLNPGGLFFIEGPLEANPSLVYSASLLFSIVKALRSPDVAPPSPSPPFHLTLASANGLQSFFEDTMGYSVLAFETDENGWPYLESGPDDGSRRTQLRRAIGRGAVALQHRLPLLTTVLSVGNRFAAFCSLQG